MCDISMFREKNWLSHDIFLLIFEGHLRDSIADFSVQLHLPQAALEFRAGNFMAAHDS